MKVTKQETLYHKDDGATLKHKCGKKDSSIAPSLFFSYFFRPSLFFMASLFLVWILIPIYGGIIVSIILSSLGTLL